MPVLNINECIVKMNKKHGYHIVNNSCFSDKPGTATINPVSSVMVSERLELVCSVDDKGSPNPVYEWWRNDDPGTILQSLETPKYVIPTARLQDNGNFTCRPRNMMGIGVSASIQVNVYGMLSSFKGFNKVSILNGKSQHYMYYICYSLYF